MTARAEWLTAGGPAAPWADLGLVIHEGVVPLFGTGIRLLDDGPGGLVSWALSGVDAGLTEIDGLPTEVVGPAAPVLAEHPLGAIGLDHVVVTTDSLDRTCGAIADATGAPLRRVRELGELRQGFHRLGTLVVEVVERSGLAAGPASFWGLVINVEDLDVAADRLGPDLIGPVKPAVQPGRSIATVREEAGLGLPVALMTP